MRLFAQAFWLQKSGSAPAEYEDAFWPTRLPVDREAKVAHFRVAIADGATETSFSALWAKLLVQSYVDDGRLYPDRFAASLARLQKRWRKAIGHKTLPWYAEEKLRNGAAAAFLGLHLRSGEAGGDGRWEAIAIGDCCLVQVRNQHVIERFPIQRSSEFSSRPFLLSTNPSACEGWQVRLRSTSGSWLPNDSLYLMSDALAAWFMIQDETDRTPWEALRDLGTTDSPSFADWIGDLRASRGLRNDDVTLLRVDLVA